MPIVPYEESSVPSIIYRRTQKSVEEELQRIENAVPEQLLSEEIVAQAHQDISSYNDESHRKIEVNVLND